MNPLLLLGLLGGGVYVAKKAKDRRVAKAAADVAEAATNGGGPTCEQMFATRLADPRSGSIPPGVTEEQLREVFLASCRAAPAESRACFGQVEPTPECMPVLMPLIGAVMQMAAPGMRAEAAAQRVADDAACRADPGCSVIGGGQMRRMPPGRSLPGAAPEMLMPGEMNVIEPPEVPAVGGLGNYVRSY